MTNKISNAGPNPNRPTSPHLQIYKWNVTSLTSIMHRLTGVVLYASIVAISWYIVYYTYQINVAQSSETCDCPMQTILSAIFNLAIVGITFSLYFHFTNGIRHLFWDMGKGFDKATAKKSGIGVFILSLIFTALTIGFTLYLKFF